jgi:hypothetical protein
MKLTIKNIEDAEQEISEILLADVSLIFSHEYWPTIIKAIAPHVQYATIPETRELTDEQLTAIDAMHDRGDFGLHVYTNLRNLFTRHPAPAPESAAPTVTKLEYQEDPQDDEANSE